MAKRTLILTLTVEVKDLPNEERNELLTELGIEKDALPTVLDIDANELGAEIACALDSDQDWQREMIWAGSEMFAQFGKIKNTKAEWN